MYDPKVVSTINHEETADLITYGILQVAAAELKDAFDQRKMHLDITVPRPRRSETDYEIALESMGSKHPSPKLIEQLKQAIAAVAGYRDITEVDNELGITSFRIAADKLKEGLYATAHPKIHKELDAAYDDAERALNAHDEIVRTETKEPFKQNAVYWQRMLSKRQNGDTKEEGVFFDTSELAKLSHREKGRKHDFLKQLDPKWRLGGERQTILKYFTSALEDPLGTLAKETSDEMQAMGFRRIAYAGHGGSTLAFEGVQNHSGNKQYILLTPMREPRIDNPLVLPAIEIRRIGGNNPKLMLRVMPGVETGPEHVTEDDVAKIREMIAASGLEPFFDANGRNELYTHNIGILHFKNEAKEDVRMPMVLDWGALKYPDGMTDERKEELRRRWETMPELEPWREAQAYLTRQQKAENMVGDMRELCVFLAQSGMDTSDPVRLSDMARLVETYGISLPELKHVVEQADAHIGQTTPSVQETPHILWAVAAHGLGRIDLSASSLETLTLPTLPRKAGEHISDELLSLCDATAVPSWRAGLPLNPDDSIDRGRK